MKVWVSVLLLGLGLWCQDEDWAASIKRGEGLYEKHCAICHLSNGEGTDKTNPPLAGADYLMEKHEASIRAIKYGQSYRIEVNGIAYRGYMPGTRMSASEVADVMNYILNSWGNQADSMIHPAWVEQI